MRTQKSKTMKGRNRWICAIVFMFVVGLAMSGFSEETSQYPKTYEISENDAERYRLAKELGKETAYDFFLKAHPSVEEKHYRFIENYGDKIDEYIGIIDGLPSDDVITEEEALFLAYAAVEEKYGYDESILALLYPDTTYDIQDKNAPLWRVGLHAVEDEIWEKYGTFYIDINAKSGMVLNCRGPEDAMG